MRRQHRWMPLCLVVVTLVVGVGGFARPAFAHGGDESKEGSVLVQQAIAYLVNEPNNLMAADEKVGDALATSDHVGVDVRLVTSARAALADGDGHRARSLLEQSIGARSHLDRADPAPIRQMGPAPTGADTGTVVAIDPLPGRRGLTGGDWIVLVGLVGVGALGIFLAIRFRPGAHAVEGEGR
jgi:hypothetical protein